MKIEYGSTKNGFNDKPNEDRYFIDKDKLSFSVIDGVSRDRVNGLYPNPSPTAVLTGKVLRHLDLFTSRYELPLDALVGLNFLISKVNETFEDKFKPGIAIIIIKIVNDVCHWASIGDCLGYYKLRVGSYNRFNTNQTANLRRAQKEKDPKYSLSRDEIRFNICNNPEHPLCYGVLDGNPKANELIECGNFPMQNASDICLYSDGLEFLDVVDIFSLPIEDVFASAQLMEFDLRLRSDDKTLIRLNLHSPLK